jgi:hypothetical protein
VPPEHRDDVARCDRPLLADFGRLTVICSRVCCLNGEKLKMRMALRWVILSICSSVRWPTDFHNTSGAFGQGVSECG